MRRTLIKIAWVLAVPAAVGLAVLATGREGGPRPPKPARATPRPWLALGSSTRAAVEREMRDRGLPWRTLEDSSLPDGDPRPALSQCYLVFEYEVAREVRVVFRLRFHNGVLYECSLGSSSGLGMTGAAGDINEAEFVNCSRACSWEDIADGSGQTWRTGRDAEIASAVSEWIQKYS